MNTNNMVNELFNKIIKYVSFGFKAFNNKVGQIVVLVDDNCLFQIVEGIKAVIRLKRYSANNVSNKKAIERALVKYLVINIGGRYLCQT